MFLSVKWREIILDHRTDFTSSYTDMGLCCKIFPQLDFEDPVTRKMSPKNYKSLMNNLIPDTERELM